MKKLIGVVVATLLGVLSAHTLASGASVGIQRTYMGFELPTKMDVPPRECAYEAQEQRVTDQLDQEPDRPRVILREGDKNLEWFRQNMKWAFDIDIDADTVYFIEARLRYPGRAAVHLFVVKNGCITYYTATDAVLMAQMVNQDPATQPHSPPAAGPRQH